MPADLPREFRYDHWANRTLLDFMAAQAEVPERARQLLAHIFGAQAVWLNRIEGRDEPARVWPDWSLAECQVRLTALAARFSGLLAKLTEEGTARPLAYRNTQGQEFTSEVGDILRHVLIHGAHHRGQIATHLRQAGLTPPPTDFILAAREGRLE